MSKELDWGERPKEFKISMCITLYNDYAHSILKNKLI